MPNIIEMPKLSDTMTDGVLVKWLRKEGETVKSGDMLAEVETDKATMELECFFDGVLLKQFAAPGSRVPIGAPLCAIGKAGEKVDAPSPSPAAKPIAGAPKAEAGDQKKAETAPAPAPTSRPPAQPAAAPAAQPSAARPLPSAPASGERLRISPLARKLAAEKNIDPSRLKGSGPGGRIVRADILDAISSGGPQAAAVRGSGPASGPSPLNKGPVQEDRVTAVSNMRATIARRLVESKTTIPHFYLDLEVDAGPLLALRVQLNAALERDGVKLSVNDFILKAAAEALRRVPAVNCSWEMGADGAPSVRQHGAAHVSFAVAIDDGLITPVVRDTHLKTIFAISTEAKSLAKRAKDKKLTPAEFTGGTFCVTNLGMMGIDRFCPIINPPNAAILAVGATVKKPVVVGDRIEIGQRLTLTLACDHRVVDGAVGATYLTAIKDLLEKPSLLLL